MSSLEKIPDAAQYGAPISLEMAKAVMQAAEAEAVREQWNLVIAIVDSGCNMIMLHKMDHAQLGSIPLAQQKAETAVRFRRPTVAFQERLRQDTQELKMLAMPNVLPVEGGIPLILGGKIVGGIGVSGARSAQDAQDAQVAVAILDNFVH
ncbi:heme-binding protein [Acidisoma cellulosilytica]|uniref:Heme-binding protein n=1 Tax=Acidisoma cellulosilyticum TaxID=2802395 RepID=A0A963Z741_9PROT|nr:heme-binding protein [Acidisoma cellulosilyticum]MCB8884050.1 heme-binding protein [Acidisoma cellulosilyticum]